MKERSYTTRSREKIRNFLGSLLLSLSIILGTWTFVPEKPVELEPLADVIDYDVIEDALAKYEYVAVFEYEYDVPFKVNKVIDVCQNSTQEMCNFTSSYFLHQNFELMKYHMQNACQITALAEPNEYNMKTIATCPIVKDDKLVGYVLVASSKEMTSYPLHNNLIFLTDRIARN